MKRKHGVFLGYAVLYYSGRYAAMRKLNIASPVEYNTEDFRYTQSVGFPAQ
jgi:hypothetical protein